MLVINGALMASYSVHPITTMLYVLIYVLIYAWQVHALNRQSELTDKALEGWKKTIEVMGEMEKEMEALRAEAPKKA